jgi:hypothetical protein
MGLSLVALAGFIFIVVFAQSITQLIIGEVSLDISTPLGIALTTIYLRFSAVCRGACFRH